VTRRTIAAGVAGAALRTPSTATPPPASAAADPAAAAAAAAAIFPAVTVSTIACARSNEFAERSCMCIANVSYTRTNRPLACSAPPLATASPAAGNTTVSGRDASCRPRTAARQAKHWRRCTRRSTACAASLSPSTNAESTGASRSHSRPDSIPA
jgi:hypothetical protein